ncbi:MAG: hypothetical protein E7426_01595 [Ruminococcaceae bacterium]|nr:hypothetical protein [Oscillospiraceae bacterium]
MAEKKEHKIVSASTGEQVTAAAKKKPAIKEAAPVGNASSLRIGAIVLWVVAIIMEVLALLVVLGKFNMKFLPTLWQLILLLVLDLACVIIGAQLWKKANHIKPASEANPLKFWLWNNMGVIVCVIAFVPIIILMLTNRDLDKKTKAIATVVAVVALLIGGVASYDFNPVSEEQQTAAISALGDEEVYWAPFGKVYHTHEDCQALNQSDTLTAGTVEQAIASNRTRLCAFCAKRDEITGVVTDEADVSSYVPEETADPAA